MELEEISRWENPLLSRTDLKYRIVHTGAPSPKRNELLDALCNKEGVERGYVIIDKIDTHFGKGESIAVVRIYRDKEVMMTIERDYMLFRNKHKEKKKKEES